VRKLLALVVVLVGLVLAYLVIDVLTKGIVEGRVENEFRDASQLEVQDVSFSIDSFPFLAKLLVSSEVSATLELEGIEDRGLTIDRFTLDVDGLTFDRMSAFNGEVKATGLDQATASLDLGASAISDVVGVPVEIRDDGTVTAGGVTIQATMSGDDLVLQGGGFAPGSVPVNVRRYLPCTPETEVRADLVHLTCTTDQLPRIVNRVLGGVNLQG
jgi:hypothetical protein